MITIEFAPGNVIRINDLIAVDSITNPFVEQLGFFANEPKKPLSLYCLLRIKNKEISINK